MATQATIKYATYIDVRGDSEIKTISHDAVDKYDFSKGFIEFLTKPEYVHLYFDFDNISNREEFENVLEWLNDISEVFGDFSWGGYTNSKDLSDWFFKYLPEAKHFLSIHVVYSETMIRASDLLDIMKVKNGKFINYKLHDKVDANVYKLNSRQAFRHILSDKTFKSKPTEKRAGTQEALTKPSDQIITVRGNEPLIEKDEWLRFFHQLKIIQINQ